MTGLLRREVASELVRSRRRGVLAGWLGLTALFTVLVNSVVYGVVADDPAGVPAGPGVAFPTLVELQRVDGLTAALGSAASMFGVVTLAFWALLTASDHSSGLVRLLVSAQPRRWRLVVGKVLALSTWTAAATTVAVLLQLLVAPVAAQAAGVSTDAWRDAGVGLVAGAWLDLYGALLVWGVLGLVLATLTRSAAVAISVGAGWVLVVEGVVGAALDPVADLLPGATLSALARGGTPDVAYGSALAAAATYLALGLGTALVAFSRRDVTD